MTRSLCALIVLLAALAAAPAALAAAPGGPAAPPLPGAVAHVDYAGVQHLHYAFGPLQIAPGQNSIEFQPNQLKPDVPGYITRFQPNLVRADGTVPPVDVIHLHHGVWIARGVPTFAAGEEKTILQLPKGYGYHYDPSDGWWMNYMVHDLTPTPDVVYVTYDIDFVPDSAAGAAGMRTVQPLWMDVAGIKAYPVFDVHRGAGRHGQYTFPDQARGAERKKIGPQHVWNVPQDVTLIGTAGHLHPGGLRTDLKATRAKRTRELFRSTVKYFEPAGAVSWDAAMTATKPSWRVSLRKGDRLNLSATYDSSRASWYESMGIDVVWYELGADPGGTDPFSGAKNPIDWHGAVTHGHLHENDHHGGGPLGLPDAREMVSGQSNGSSVTIKDFVYAAGDLSSTGATGRPPTVRAGHSLTFVNADHPTSIYHTITSCRNPCNRETGIAFPLANGARSFDSGELGYGPAFATAASNRVVWRTPKNLPPGTYSYFCRIHPFMRGAFRVVR